MFCNKCGNIIDERAAFCPNCGNRVKIYNVEAVDEKNSPSAGEIIFSILICIMPIVGIVMGIIDLCKKKLLIGFLELGFSITIWTITAWLILYTA